MKVSKRAAAFICALMMSAASVSAVSAFADDSAGQAASETVRVGKVTEVSGSQLTVALGEFSRKKTGTETAEGEESADGSEKSARSGMKKSHGSKCEAKEKSAGAEASEEGAAQSGETGKTGKKHGGKGRHHGKFTENGTTETVDTEGAAVTKKGEDAAVSDISVGDIVKLKYDENGELTKVKVCGHRHGKKAEAAAQEETA
ncbi:MAG: hypothetical protein IKP47_10570 [Ruminococcus sp.]|nr:hypothetical protein [Ruminococcus sp.]